ncbi:juvenile hormone acid O-methyltransferase isoform X1 [Uranotaenia lowii]|uniref:juvenile hormone acid O-methyltransferase isoform X1 n=1 Tax=Uranotaenia lowii TaxID=190385 RepID=UPI00247AFD41|nr:juvenile hormone acid O-methyltransferase isoform X1 [Uranotaenia lowii]
MNEPNLYQKSNGVQQRDAQEVLNEYRHIFKCRSTTNDGSLLDIGSGSGDVLIDFVLPLLPSDFSRVLGIDVSEKMVQYAAKVHSDIPNLHFDCGDIEKDVDTIVSKWGHFNYVISFYCLHWIKDQRKALSNIRNLLAEGGECLLVFLACNPIYDIFYELSRHPKWAPYMTNVEKFISPYQYSSNPTEDINKQLTHVGFSFHSVKVLDKIYIYEGEECMRNAVKAVNPFREQMLPDVQEDFMNDYVDVVRRMLVSPDNKCDDNNYSVITPYKLAIIYAKK